MSLPGLQALVRVTTAYDGYSLIHIELNASRPVNFDYLHLAIPVKRSIARLFQRHDTGGGLDMAGELPASNALSDSPLLWTGSDFVGIGITCINATAWAAPKGLVSIEADASKATIRARMIDTQHTLNANAAFDIGLAGTPVKPWSRSDDKLATYEPIGYDMADNTSKLDSFRYRY